MRRHLSFLLSLCAISLTCCLPSDKNLTLGVGNGGGGIIEVDNEIDPRFGMRASAGPHTLGSLSTYMNSIAYLSNLNQEDFTGVVSTADIISLDPWDDVAIAVLPLEANLERRFIMWGIYQGLEIMATNHWREYTFILTWNQIGVGRLQFNAIAKASQKAGLIDSPHDKNTIGLGTKRDLLSNPQISPNTARITLNPSYFPNPERLMADGVFQAMAGVICHLGRNGRENRLTDFVYLEAAHRTHVGLANTGPTGSGPRVWKNKQGSSAIWKFAKWIVEQDRYDECKTNVKLAGRPVGRIGITKAESLDSFSFA